ncbi:uracil-DNA glycosylase, partial [Elioraea sp. Yellowstone]
MDSAMRSELGAALALQLAWGADEALEEDVQDRLAEAAPAGRERAPAARAAGPAPQA